MLGMKKLSRVFIIVVAAVCAGCVLAWGAPGKAKRKVKQRTRTTSTWNQRTSTQPLFEYSYSKKDGWVQKKGPVAVKITDWLFVIFFFIFMALSRALKVSNGRRSTRRGLGWGSATTQKQLSLAPLPNHNDAISLALCETDPELNTQEFLEWAKSIFLQVQQARMQGNAAALRAIETPERYAHDQAQIAEDTLAGRVCVFENITFKNAYLFLLRQEKENEFLAVFLQVNMLAYVLDGTSNKVLSGSRTAPSDLGFLYMFKRARGKQRKNSHARTEIVTCPHCGAPADLEASERCAYCDTIIKPKSSAWALDDIIRVSPPYSNYGPGGVRRND